MNKLYYVVLINGTVATIAHLTQEDGDRLTGMVKRLADEDDLNRIEVVWQTEAASTLMSAVADVENELESW